MRWEPRIGAGKSGVARGRGPADFVGATGGLVRSGLLLLAPGKDDLGVGPCACHGQFGLHCTTSVDEGETLPHGSSEFSLQFNWGCLFRLLLFFSDLLFQILYVTNHRLRP